MRDYKKEFEGRVAFIKKVVTESSATGSVFGNSGGKASALVGILCKAACENTVGVILPCSSKRNYSEDVTQIHHAELELDSGEDKGTIVTVWFKKHN